MLHSALLELRTVGVAACQLSNDEQEVIRVPVQPAGTSTSTSSSAGCLAGAHSSWGVMQVLQQPGGGGAGKGGRLNGILSLPLYTFLKGLPRRSQSAVLGGNSPAVALVPEKALTQLVPIATSASGGLFLLIS